MEQVLRQYVDYMNESFQGQFRDMNSIIAETTKAQTEIRDQMIAFGEHLQKQFEVHSELIDKTSRAGQILSSSLGSLEHIAQELKTAANNISSAANMLEKAASRAMEGQETLKETMEKQIQTVTSRRTAEKPKAPEKKIVLQPSSKEDFDYKWDIGAPIANIVQQKTRHLQTKSFDMSEFEEDPKLPEKPSIQVAHKYRSSMAPSKDEEFDEDW